MTPKDSQGQLSLQAPAAAPHLQAPHSAHEGLSVLQPAPKEAPLPPLTIFQPLGARPGPFVPSHGDMAVTTQTTTAHRLRSEAVERDGAGFMYEAGRDPCQHSHQMPAAQSGSATTC